MAVAVDGNERGVPGRSVPAGVGAVALVLGRLLVRSGRSGWAFARPASPPSRGRDPVHRLYPRVLVSRPDFANSLTVAERPPSTTRSLITVVAAGLHAARASLYQGWTYHVFRARLAGGG